VDVTVLRAGVTHDQVYGRLADNYRYLRSTGASEADALTQTLQRAEVVAATDVDLAMRGQAARFAEVHHLQYRRVLHPELSRHGACGLCVAASDRVYYRGDLMPIHARCKCEVLPIIGSKDPGQSINKADLDRLYAAAGGTTAGETSSGSASRPAPRRARPGADPHGSALPRPGRHRRIEPAPDTGEEHHRTDPTWETPTWHATRCGSCSTSMTCSLATGRSSGQRR
jgi:hypothetical protein